MAIDSVDLMRPAEEVREAPRAPLSGTRSQSMQRLQIGLSGLAAMVLLVGLADIISTNLQRNEAQVVPEAAPTASDQRPAAPARDPLADAGVVPELPASSSAQRAPRPAPNGDASPATR